MMKVNYIVVVTTFMCCFIYTTNTAIYSSSFNKLLEDDFFAQKNINRVKRQAEEETDIEISVTESETGTGDIETEVEVTEDTEIAEGGGETETGGEDDGVTDMPNGGDEENPARPERPNHRCRSKRKQFPKHKTCCGHRSLLFDLFDMHNPSAKQIIGSCRREIKEKFRRKIKEELSKKGFNCEKKEELKRKGNNCLYECVMKKRDMVNSEGSIDFAQIRNEVDRRWPEEEWIRALVLRAVDTCEHFRYDTAWMNDQSGIRCNPQSMELTDCLWREIELNCPEEHQSLKRHCKIMRHWIAETDN